MPFDVLEKIELEHIIKFLIILIICYTTIRITDIAFDRMQRNKRRLHLRFLENIIRIGIVLFSVLFLFSGMDGFSRLYRLMFGSTVVVTAIIGLAGQDILRDVFAGVMLSVCKPFEIGDRVLLDAVEKPCVVEDMTMRHVVLKTMDGIRYIVPNKEINDSTITNTSYKQTLRGTFIKIPIAYTADVRKAVLIVRETIEKCPYTFPNNPDNEDIGGYGEVYVMSYDNSSLNLETTIWTEPSVDNFLACSEIRMSILEAFRRNDIEIPYNYTNVIIKQEESDKKFISVEPRNISVKSDIVNFTDFRNSLKPCQAKVTDYCKYHGIDDRNKAQLLLITEELMSFSDSLIRKARKEFWIEGNQDTVKLCIKTEQEFSKKKQLRLINSVSDLPAVHQIIAKLRVSLTNNIEPNGWLFESQDSSDHNLEKMLLEAYSDNVRIGIIDKYLVIIVSKKL